jgi:glucose dehydrogenase
LFRAFDTKTGRELWTAELVEQARSVPITYLGVDGRQYVTIAAGATLQTFALPLASRPDARRRPQTPQGPS